MDTGELILLCAFRYALRRKSYIVSVVRGEIKRRWCDLTDQARDTIREEIWDMLDNPEAGMSDSVEDWREVLGYELADAEAV